MTLLSLRSYRLLIATSIAMVALAIALCEILIPSHGARGAAVVTLSLELVLVCAYGATLYITHRELQPGLAPLARIALALGLGFGAALAVPVSSVPAALIGSAVLAAAAVALRAVPVELWHALRPHRE